MDSAVEKKISPENEQDLTIPIIIPAYEPDGRLLDLLKQMMELDMAPVIIIDDGSGKDYRHIFQRAIDEYGAIVLCHDVNRGKGCALKTAFSYCLNQYSLLGGCITADSDGQHLPISILACRDALLEKKDSLILGVRDFSNPGVPRKSSVGNKLSREIFRVLYKKDITDTQTGLRGIPASYMVNLISLQGERFEYETRMLTDVIEKQIEIIEVVIETIYDSREDHATHFRPIVDSIRIYKVFGFSFVRFILSSCISSVIDLLLFQVLCVIFSSRFIGTGYIAIATIMARAVSAACNYIMNYFYVFSSREGHKKTALKYLVLAAAQCGLSAVITTGIWRLIPARVEVFVKIPVDIILFFVSYRVQKTCIY